MIMATLKLASVYLTKEAAIQWFKEMDWDELKKTLKEYEAEQDYETCRLIQNEIDSRVNA